jgi:hypothetical protein
MGRPLCPGKALYESRTIREILGPFLATIVATDGAIDH